MRPGRSEYALRYSTRSEPELDVIASRNIRVLRNAFIPTRYTPNATISAAPAMRAARRNGRRGVGATGFAAASAVTRRRGRAR
jgi:hypothetical protein